MRTAITASVWSGDPVPARFNLAAHALHAAARVPGKTALIVAHEAGGGNSDEVWTYRDLEGAVLRTASALVALGLRPGDRVLLRLGNSSHFAVAFLAATAAGAMPVPLSGQLTAAEVEFVAADADARLIVVDPALPTGDAAAGRTAVTAEELARLAASADPARYAATGPDDPAYLVYTSGTTRSPKGVVHAHRALWGRRPTYADWLGIGPDDVLLHAGALNWTYTLGVGLLDPLAAGATGAVYSGKADPSVWPRLLERLGATIFAGVPTVYRQILKYCDIRAGSFPRLRHGLAAGEALRPDVADGWTAATGRRICEAFGMSEVSTYISTPPGVAPRPGSPGRPQTGRAVAILPADGGTDPLPCGETGVIAVHRSDPGLMLGYWRRPDEQPFRGDWFVTGDLASMDEDGFVWPQGRADEVVKVMGYRVSPVEVEAVIGSHPAVAEAAVVAVEPRPGVTILRACVVAREGTRIDADGLLAFARERLAGYKAPKELLVVPALPRTANGKIQRARLRDLSP